MTRNEIIDVRSTLARKISHELDISYASIFVRKMSVPVSCLFVKPYKATNEEYQIKEDSLRHVGVAFYNENFVKYVDINGVTYIAPAKTCVLDSLRQSNFTTIASTSETKNPIKCDEVITSAREKMFAPNWKVEDPFLSRNCGLSKDLLDSVNQFEQVLERYNDGVCNTGAIPFRNQEDIKLGESTSIRTASLLYAFSSLPAEGSDEIIAGLFNRLEPTCAVTLMNEKQIEQNFDQFKSQIFGNEASNLEDCAEEQ